MPRPPKQLPGEIRDGLVMYPNGRTWHYVVRWRGEKRMGDTKCESRTNAATWLEDERERWAQREHGRSLGPPLTLYEVWQSWEEKKTSSVSKSHARFMKGVVAQHVYEWQSKPITELNGAAISTLKDRYMSSSGEGFKKGGGHTIRKHSEGGWNKVLVQLRALVGFAIQEGMILERTFKAKGQWLKPSPKAPGFLWPEQVQAFLAAIDAMRKNRVGDPVCHPGIYVRLMIGCGLRAGEALNLEWDRVDWRQNCIVIASARVNDWRPKDRDLRTIELPQWLRDYLLTWWAFLGRPTEGLVLESRHGGAHGEGTTKRAIVRGAAALKIQGLHPHSMRETFATTQWEIGATLDEIAEMLGHEDPDTTLRHYIRRRPKGQIENQAKAAKLMGFVDSSGPSGPTQ